MYCIDIASWFLSTVSGEHFDEFFWCSQFRLKSRTASLIPSNMEDEKRKRRAWIVMRIPIYISQL
jgi:hypothetical protein